MELKTAAEMCYLIACALHGQEPEDKVLAGMDLPEVYKLAARHSLSALCWLGLGSKTDAVPEEVREKWSAMLARSIFKNEKRRLERNALFAFMEERGIRYLPLKGSVLQDLYPTPGAREMVDNDILFDVTHDEEVRDYFVGRGYKAEQYRIGNHDEYLKPPYFNFEMHRGLFSDYSNTKWGEYYRDPFGHAVPDGTGVRYHFPPNDLYAYVMTHACKHYALGSTGIRTLIDCYLMNHSYCLERGYVNAELEKLDIAKFEREAAALSEKLFGAVRTPAALLAALTETEKKALGYYVSSGAQGTRKNMVANELHQFAGEGKPVTLGTKLRYFVRGNLFPNKEFMENWCKAAAPFFLRHRYLFWLSPIYRILIRGFLKTSRQKFKYLADFSEEETEK